MVFGPMPYGMAMTLFRTNESSDQSNAMGFRTNGNGPSDQWYFGPMGRRTNGNGNGLSDHRHGTTMSITPAEARRACRTDEML